MIMMDRTGQRPIIFTKPARNTYVFNAWHVITTQRSSLMCTGAFNHCYHYHYLLHRSSTTFTKNKKLKQTNIKHRRRPTQITLISITAVHLEIIRVHTLKQCWLLNPRHVPHRFLYHISTERQTMNGIRLLWHYLFNTNIMLWTNDMT